jgi:hypothetical protein
MPECNAFAWATEDNMLRLRVANRISEKLGLGGYGLRFADGKIYRKDRRRSIGTDLETLARKFRVLRHNEHLGDPPLCSRCKRRVADMHWTGGYLRQCSRCYEWSRSTRRDPTRCTNCRRTKDKPAQVKGISRCSECHTTKLERERNDRFLTPPWERPARQSFWT